MAKAGLILTPVCVLLTAMWTPPAVQTTKTTVLQVLELIIILNIN